MKMEMETLRCRTCAKSDVRERTLHWLNLFQTLHCAEEIQQIHTQLANWSLQVRSNDGLSQSICDECFAQFCQVFNFRQRCTEAHRKLSNYMKRASEVCNKLEVPIVECEWQALPSADDATNTEITMEEQHLLSTVALNFDECFVTDYGRDFQIDDIIEDVSETTAQQSQQTDSVEVEGVADEQQLFELLDESGCKNSKVLDASETTVDRLACEVCGKQYADRFNLRHHYEKYHSDIDFECTLCEKRFNSRRSLRYHLKWHDETAQLKCSHCDCDRLFISKRQLDSHEQTHAAATKKTIRCTLCDKTFVHAKTLRWHTYRHHGGEKPVKCGNCDAVFETYLEKRLHSLELHVTNLTAIERIECISCHERFINESELISHMKTVHIMPQANRRLPIITANSKRVLQQRLPPTEQGRGLLQCDICGKRFHMRSALERHRGVHSTDGRPHECSICKKRFKRSQDRNWHMKTHSNDKPNVCEVCGKGFALSYVLNQHRRSHDVLEKKYACGVCERSYLSEKSLRLHERIHTGQTYYQCDFCELQFVTHIKLKYHMQKQHINEEQE